MGLLDHETCDHGCVTKARTVALNVVAVAGIPAIRALTLCGHHTAVHGQSLTDEGWIVLDIPGLIAQAAGAKQSVVEAWYHYTPQEMPPPIPQHATDPCLSCGSYSLQVMPHSGVTVCLHCGRPDYGVEAI